ncbi:hypothetical protein KSP40_PGU006562 [Platanthera guangdongensis]|uniref:Ribosomal L1 domain-containing protein 1 n=1 Tax=Platanthera guangdongensis TaxID=2320717 RepID=A0ABR2LE49_9ASPA
MTSKPTIKSSRVSREDAGRAVDALLGFLRARAKQQKAQLFEHDDFLYLNISVRRLRSTSRLKPYLIPLPHTLHPLDPSRTSLCLIADDSLADAARSTAADENLPFDSIIPLSQLRTDYVPFEARRRLCDSYDIFFAERRIVPPLSRLIGNYFFKKNKIPLPINISRRGWPEAVREACRSTLLHLSSGTCSGLKVGRVSMDREQIIDNLMTTIDAAVDHIPKKWANIRCMYIMAVQSVALPIYQAIPEIGMKIDVGPREKTERLVGVVDQEPGAKREVEEKNKKKRGLSKKRKMRIHDVDFTGIDIHDRSEEGDGDGQEEHANDELGLKKKMKKDEQEKLRKCKKGKSAGNEKDECEEKVKDGEFIELVTERKKTKRAKKIANTGVKDFAIKVVSADDHGDGKKKKMKNGVKRSKCTDDDDDKEGQIQLANERKKTKRANKAVNTASEEYAIKDGFTDDHGDGKKLQLKKKEKKIMKKDKDKKGKQDIFNCSNEDHGHVVAYEVPNLMNMDANIAVNDDDHDLHFSDEFSRVKTRANLDRKSAKYKKPVKAKKIKLRQ